MTIADDEITTIMQAHTQALGHQRAENGRISPQQRQLRLVQQQEMASPVQHRDHRDEAHQLGDQRG